MKMKSLVLLAMALGCGFVAMLGVQQVLSGDKKPREETGKVLVALTTIMPGVPLDETNVTFKDWRKNEIPEGAVTSKEQYEKRSLRVAAVPNEVIMSAKLNEEGVFGGSSEIPEGMRVATVPVNVTKTHSGLILPGDRVDVVVTYTVDVPGHRPIKKAKTILQYIEVFATDSIRQSAVPNGENKEISAKNISLLVTPDQYNLLMLAENKGQISLALRHRGDDSEVKPSDIDDTMFEQVKVARGRSNKDDGKPSENEPEKSGVNEALEKERTKVADAKAAKDKEKEKEVAAKPTWTIKVYEGSKLREEEVELPSDPNDAVKGLDQSGGRWQRFLKGIFHKTS